MAMPTATPQGTLPNNRQSPLSLLFPSGPHPAMPHTHQEVIWGKSRPMVLEASVQGVQGSPPPEVGLLIHQLRKLSLAALEGGVKKGRNGGSQARGKETNQVSQHRRSRWGRLGWGAGPSSENHCRHAPWTWTSAPPTLALPSSSAACHLGVLWTCLPGGRALLTTNVGIVLQVSLNLKAESLCETFHSSNDLKGRSSCLRTRLSEEATE